MHRFTIFAIIFTCISVIFVESGNAFPNIPAQDPQAPAVNIVSYMPEFVQDGYRWMKDLQAQVNKQIPKYMKGLREGEGLYPVLLACFMAFMYGVFHTFGPGHGKTVVATYFLTREAKYSRGILMGLQFSAAHVMGAVVLVFVADISLKTFIFNPEQQVFWVRVISYGAIVLVGLFMLFNGLTHLFKSKGKPAHSCSHCAKHAHGAEKKELSFLSIFSGVVPCTGSLLILLYAMAHNILHLGIFMVIMVGLGMASAMIFIGFLSIFGQKVYASKWVGDDVRAHKVKLYIELFGALFLTCIGGLLLLVTVV